MKKILLLIILLILLFTISASFISCGNKAWVSESFNNTFNYIAIKEPDGNWHIHKIKKWSDSESESFTVQTDCCGNYFWGSVNNAILYKNIPDYIINSESENILICEKLI